MSQFFSRVIENAARSEGYGYANVTSIAQAMAALDAGGVDLIITARILEDGNSETMLTSLMQGPHRNVPIIVVTSDDSLENRERFFSLGVMDYLLKSDLVPGKLTQYFSLIGRGGELLDALRNMRVAVLDDSSMSLRVVRSIFHSHGVKQCQYFQESEEMFKAGDFDLYIIDLVMPKRSGEEVLLQVRTMNPRSGIIMVSASSNRVSLAHTLVLGADDYVSKPFDAQDFITRVKGVVRQMVLLQKIEEKGRQMEEMAKRDSLTGLWNHGSIHEYLHGCLEGDEQVAVLLFDLDDFKSINDTFGHQSGDSVLMMTGKSLRDGIGPAGEVGRYGGEEFMAVLPGMDGEGAAEIAEALLEHLRQMPSGLKERQITCSCGVADVRDGRVAPEIVEQADARLYMAKSAGKDQVVDRNHEPSSLASEEG